MRRCSLPILVVHGEKDRTFPVELGEQLHALCGAKAELLIIRGHGHKEPFRHPRLAYWGLFLIGSREVHPHGTPELRPACQPGLWSRGLS
jgi:pimeloyl-ACP methyl ester carboxylesterase